MLGRWGASPPLDVDGRPRRERPDRGSASMVGCRPPRRRDASGNGGSRAGSPNVAALVVDDDPFYPLAGGPGPHPGGTGGADLRDADAALSAHQAGEPMEMLLTDVAMPGELDGIALAARVAERRPECRSCSCRGMPGRSLEGASARRRGHPGQAVHASRARRARRGARVPAAQVRSAGPPCRTGRPGLRTSGSGRQWRCSEDVAGSVARANRNERFRRRQGDCGFEARPRCRGHAAQVGSAGPRQDVPGGDLGGSVPAGVDQQRSALFSSAIAGASAGCPTHGKR